MYYVGMRGVEDIDFLALPRWSEDIKSLLEFFWDYRSVCCVFNGEIEFIKTNYLEKIEDKLLEWEQDLEYKFLDEEPEKEYLSNIQALRTLISK